MKTKYFFVLMMAVLMGTQVMEAQNEQGKKTDRRMRKRMTMEQMADMQASKIANDLGLDDKTSVKFTDLYKKYMKEMDDVRKEFVPDFMAGDKKEGKKDGKDQTKKKALTDEEVDKIMRDRFKQSRKMLDIREKYYDEFRKFLSPKQVQKVYDQGMMNHGMFHKELNRRAGMKQMEGGRPAPQGRPFPQQ